eukprot:5294064-Amphidinium_carterae.1
MPAEERRHPAVRIDDRKGVSATSQTQKVAQLLWAKLTELLKQGRGRSCKPSDCSTSNAPRVFQNRHLARSKKG